MPDPDARGGHAPASARGSSCTAHDVRVGISGWRYPRWRGVFYPPGLAQSRELAYASLALRTLEINGSFYSLQRPSSYEAWHSETPGDFVFAVKGSRFVTHAKKLVDCGTPLANFFASGVLALREKLGPVLWQLPPHLPFEARRLEEFLRILPRATSAAAALGARHDARLRHGAFVRSHVDRPIRHAIEVRHESYRDAAFVGLLRESGVALCVADTAGRWPSMQDVTADFVYVRLHGAAELYAGGYGPRALDRWAARIAAWRDGGYDVYVYFDNDAEVRAPYDAMNLAARLGHGHRVRFPREALRRTAAGRAAGAPAAARGRRGSR